MFKRGIVLSIGLLAGMLAAGLARADSVEMKNNVIYRDAMISSLDGDKLIFTANGPELVKFARDVKRLSVDGEIAFNAAEDAYVAGQFDKATDGYDKTLSGTQKAWLRDWCMLRLVDSAGKAGRFDVTVKTLIQLAEKSPDAAAGMQIKLPDARSTYLADGIRLLEAASKKPGQKDKANEVILKMLSDLYAVKQDAKAKADTDYRLAQLAVKINPNSEIAQQAATQVKLNRIREALVAKSYDQVIQTVNAEAATIVEPADQAEAMFCLAEAMAGKAAGSSDADKWKEVAVAYMRVVANAPAASPRVPDALLRTASICAQQLNDKEAAKRIYKQIKEEYKDQPAAREADKAMQNVQ